VSRTQQLEVEVEATVLRGPGRGPGGSYARSLGREIIGCPVPGCPATINRSRLMCRADWYKVPRAVRNQVWATWRSGAGALSPEHCRTVQAALTAAASPDLSAGLRILAGQLELTSLMRLDGLGVKVST
jgi:hypothetical protein